MLDTLKMALRCTPLTRLPANRYTPTVVSAGIVRIAHSEYKRHGTLEVQVRVFANLSAASEASSADPALRQRSIVLAVPLVYAPNRELGSLWMLSYVRDAVFRRRADALRLNAHDALLALITTMRNHTVISGMRATTQHAQHDACLLINITQPLLH